MLYNIVIIKKEERRYEKSLWMIVTIFAIFGIGSAALALNRPDYPPQEECFLCGNTKNSILNLYNNVNGVGILNFNNFTVSTLRLCNEEHVISISGSSHTTNVSGKGGSIVSIDSNSSRRIADVTISIRDGSRPHLKEMARFLCADCCKQIKQENTYDVAFIDYQTKELFPIKENIVEFYINDYAIHRLNIADDLEYLVFYAPEQ